MHDKHERDYKRLLEACQSIAELNGVLHDRFLPRALAIRMPRIIAAVKIAQDLESEPEEFEDVDD